MKIIIYFRNINNLIATNASVVLLNYTLMAGMPITKIKKELYLHFATFELVQLNN